MACKTYLLLFVFTCLMSYTHSAARELTFRSLASNFNQPQTNHGATNPLDCLNALSEIRSCYNEITAYFTIGRIDISSKCCQSITLITRQCWPAMLSSLGFTPDQTYILRGYCDASASNVASFSPAPSPSHAQSPAPAASFSTAPSPSPVASVSPAPSPSHAPSPTPAASFSTAPSPSLVASFSPGPSPSHAPSPAPAPSASHAPSPTPALSPIPLP